MVYVFKKVNDLLSPIDKSTPTSGEAIVSPTQSSQEAVSAKNPYQSTFRNPSKIFEANVGENMGQLKTGVSESIAQQRKGMEESTAKYSKNLQDVQSRYSYNRPDIQNVQEDEAYSRLSNVLNPQRQQTELQNQTTNTQNYRPDVAGLASASTVGGLTGQLQQQYGTTPGQARLDTLLFRGSGQAGKEIRKGIQDVESFRASQQEALNRENQQLQQALSQAGTQAGQARADIGGFADQLSQQAAQQAAQQQQSYDVLYNQRQQELQNILANQGKLDPASFQARIKESLMQNTPPEMTEALMRQLSSAGFAPSDLVEQAYGEKTLQIPRLQAIEQLRQTYPEAVRNYLSDVTAKQWAQAYQAPNINLSDYIESKSSFTPEQYLDPRFNRLQSLIGGQQRTLSPDTTPDMWVGAKNQQLQQALSDDREKYIQEQLGKLSPQSTTTPSDKSYVDVIKDSLTQAVQQGLLSPDILASIISPVSAISTVFPATIADIPEPSPVKDVIESLNPFKRIGGLF